MSNTIKDRINDIGQPLDEVILQVDYQIIEHFSENLYDSPNKAVEELVANGFDAFATHVRVYVPGEQTTDRVLVWDNGQSMDIEGLKRLWWIARSPKTDGDRQIDVDGSTRKVIGKFGIGKLASYAVGRVISHLCRHRDEFYLVCVDYGDIRGSGDRPSASTNHPISAPIVGLKQEDALDLVRGLFDNEPASLLEAFSQESWTLAIVEALKQHDLAIGRLKWVVGNGMPLRPDFVVDINEERVHSRLKKEAVIEWDYGSPEVVEAIRSAWRDHVHRRVPLEFDSEVGLDPSDVGTDTPFVKFPNLGRVWGFIRIFDETLMKYRSVDNGRSHGFFLFVRGRLVNPDDDKLYHPEPSFQTFYRSQIIIYADDLDLDLLADRQHLREGNAVRELAVLQRAIGGAARVTVEAREAAEIVARSAASILPIGSRTFYRDPLGALMMDAEIDEASEFNVANVDVQRRDMGSDRPISEFVLNEGSFVVNSSHPYYEALQSRVGHSRAAHEFLRTLDLFAVSERLLEGHLIDLGIDRAVVEEVVVWREGLFKQLAISYGGKPELIREMSEASYVGGSRFEHALKEVFVDMGFSAQHRGASGQEDVHVLATVGRESFSFVLEAKGSGNRVGNRDAAVGAAASHRDVMDADHAIIVARSFAGFGDGGDDRSAALLKECKSTGGVSIMELAAVEELHGAIMTYSYPLPLLKDIFFSLDTPAEKLSRIESLVAPVEGFDYRALLEEIWRRQGSEAKGELVPYLSVYQQGRWKEDGMNFNDFECRLVALDTLSAGRIRMHKGRRELYLRQSPALILEQIERSLYGEGHDIPEATS